MKYALLTALVVASFFIPKSVEATCWEHCHTSTPHPTASPTVSPTPKVSPYVSPTPSATVLPTPSSTPSTTPLETSTPTPTLQPTTGEGSKLSDGKSDNLGCSVNDCSGNRIPTREEVLAAEIVAHRGQGLPETGSGFDPIFILGIASLIITAGLALRTIAKRMED